MNPYEPPQIAKPERKKFPPDIKALIYATLIVCGVFAGNWLLQQYLLYEIADGLKDF